MGHSCHGCYGAAAFKKSLRLHVHQMNAAIGAPRGCSVYTPTIVAQGDPSGLRYRPGEAHFSYNPYSFNDGNFSLICTDSVPSFSPTITPAPSFAPSFSPSFAPTSGPSLAPTSFPTPTSMSAEHLAAVNEKASKSKVVHDEKAERHHKLQRKLKQLEVDHKERLRKASMHMQAVVDQKRQKLLKKMQEVIHLKDVCKA